MEREDNVPIDRQDRRLDELAWLLEGTSMCVAITVFNGSFYISVNEFTRRTRSKASNKQVQFICDVMEYFCNIANKQTFGKNVEELRDVLMKKIVEYQVSSAFQGKAKIPNEMLQEVITSKVLHEGNLPRDNIHDKATAHIALGYGMMIHNRIRKIESSIEKALRGDYSIIGPDKLQAFKQFSHVDKLNSNILFFEEEAGVHAELQILSQIIAIANEKKSRSTERVYIGVSKRCCFHCNHMLEASKQVLAKKGLNIEFEGAHGASFADNWVLPLAFKECAEEEESESKKVKSAVVAVSSSSSIQESEQIVQQIYEIYKIKIGSNTPATKYPSTRHDASGSEHSATAEQLAEAYKNRLGADLETLERMDLAGTEQAAMLSLLLEICKIEEFMDLFDDDVLLVIKASAAEQTQLEAILVWLNKNQISSQGKAVDERVLLELLSNKKFTPEKIAECFTSLSLGASHGTQSSVLMLKG